MALTEMPVEDVLGPVTCLLLEDSSSEVQAVCLDLLERFGAVISLAGVRTDGWFQKIGEEIKNFNQVCEVMGEHLLAYAIILGVRIRSLTTDPRFVANTTVEFTVGEDEELQTLTLGEFRIRIVQALIHGEPTVATLNLPVTEAQVRQVIGEHNLLLASLFGLSLEQFVVSAVNVEPARGLVGYISEGGFNFIDVRDFGDLIRQKVRRDLAGVSQEPFQLDLGAVERARAAFEKEDYDGVIAALEIWPGLLSILQRTPVVQDLDAEQRAAIGEGLELLGTAFKKRDRGMWALELYRLGLQFVREGVPAGRLFYNLALSLKEQERYGEMIGLLRRALVLGVEESEVLPLLGHSYLRQGMVVAAAALLNQAATKEMETEDLAEDLKLIHNLFTRTGIEWDVPGLSSPQ